MEPTGSVVSLMKLKDKLQQVLVARNCCRTGAIPKLPQADKSQAQMHTSIFPLLTSRGMVSKCPENEEAAEEIFQVQSDLY